MIIVFDTETTGLPKDYSASAEDVDNWPRITQLAYSIHDKEGNVLKRFCKLIKPDGWVMPTEEFWIKNGFSQEKSMAEGVPIAEALNEYIADRLASQYAAAHNMSFDSKIVRAEMIRLGLKVEFTAKKICTMQKSTKYAQIPNKSGKGFKWPTLTELHTKLFGVPFESAHDAGGDVDACAKCLFHLIKLNVIPLD